MTNHSDWQRLLRKIRSRRGGIAEHLATARPRAERLTTVTVVSSVVAAFLTAGPAVGRTKFTEFVAKWISPLSGEDVWVICCSIAMVLAMIAAISANLRTSSKAETEIVNALACSAELEGLQEWVESRQLPYRQCAELYRFYVNKIPFIPEDPSP